MESRKDKRNDQKNIASEESVAATSTTTKEVEIKTKTTTTNKKQVIMVPNQSTHVSMAPSKVAMNQVKFVDSYSSPTKIKEDDQYKNNNDDDDNDDFYEDEGQFMSAKTSYDQMENRNRRMQALESFNDWMTSENSQIHSESDEDESCDMQLFDTNDDWISHISRPKSDWEDMRQARYEEMLEDQSSANGDIQRLLERQVIHSTFLVNYKLREGKIIKTKNVSSFLGSGLRDLIDQLMTSRIQQSQTQTEKQDLVVRKKAESGKEIELQDGLVVAEDRRSITETKCSKYNEYVDQASYLERSWKPNDVVCNSETTTTTSPSETTTTTSPSETATTTSPFIEPSFSFKWSHNNSIPQSSPAITHQTIEMELIYEMRGHMEQLHHEIMDLRKSIKSCVNMQVKLQYSFKQNVGAAATHSG
ncbi:uncharacterized protein LOC143573608 [Bidens hawaiensis]|uniref:uncharacterized protein LOC143573608 n=1 Tax=Bidens hawaiensis TaxID=980011 RepID=UPI00404A1D13